MNFIHDDFLLQTKTAQRLYHEFAQDQPIIDYHNHLPPQDIAENRQFATLYDIWLEGDHYKWRAMRAAGVREELITGKADPYDKFIAWAKTVPQTLRNPLFHWTHLELKRYFGIDTLLDAETADEIWEEANRQLATPELSVHGILTKFNIKALCTTDDPGDDLRHHAKIAESDLDCKVYPAYRPDKALNAHDPKLLNPWVDRLADAWGKPIKTFADFLSALKDRHDYFHELGCRLSDTGLPHCYADFCSEETAAGIFAKVRAGEHVSEKEHHQYASFVMLFLGRLDHEKGWTRQLHLGPLRNNCTRLYRTAGPDTGFDSLGDNAQAVNLSRYLDKLDETDSLPKTIVYNVNPKDSFTLATMIGNFQDGSIPGKMQYGAAWWYLDQKEGIEWQLNVLSNTGLLSRFVGMLTDSRSFMSFPRHEYFRRTLCNVLGNDVEKGELPDDDSLLGPLVTDICFNNAREYLGLEF